MQPTRFSAPFVVSCLQAPCGSGDSFGRIGPVSQNFSFSKVRFSDIFALRPFVWKSLRHSRTFAAYFTAYIICFSRLVTTNFGFCGLIPIRLARGSYLHLGFNPGPHYVAMSSQQEVPGLSRWHLDHCGSLIHNTGFCAISMLPLENGYPPGFPRY